MAFIDFSSCLIISAFQPPPKEWLHLQAKPRNIIIIWLRAPCVCLCVHVHVQSCLCAYVHGGANISMLLHLTHKHSLLLIAGKACGSKSHYSDPHAPFFPALLESIKTCRNMVPKLQKHYFKNVLYMWLIEVKTVIHGTIKMYLFGGWLNSCVMLGRVPAGWVEVKIYCFSTLINPPLRGEG